MAMLGGVRALAARVCRLAAAVGHTVGAAEKKDAEEDAGAAARSAAELVDFAPDEIAALLDADASAYREFALHPEKVGKQPLAKIQAAVRLSRAASAFGKKGRSPF